MQCPSEQKPGENQILFLIVAYVVVFMALGSQSVYGDKKAEEGNDLNREGGAKAQQTGSDVQLTQIGLHSYQLGSLIIDADERTVTCPGEVNMDKGGPIELLACTATGKRHETIFVLDTRPFHFQIALLLLGVSEGYNEAAENGDSARTSDVPPADTVSIDVRWRKEDEKGGGEEWIRRSANEFLYNVKKDETMHEVEWAFVGSKWEDNIFKADQTGSIVVTYHDLFGVLELASKEVNSDTWFEANEEAIPPVGTEVELIVKVHNQTKDETQNQRE